MIGQTLSHFRITAKLGEGGMGEVYRAEDTKLGREVAIKVLPPQVANDPERRKRFEREAKAVAALNHPNIVTVYSIEEHEGTHFIAMELVEGQSFSELIPNDGLSTGKLLSYAIDVSDAVAAAHRKGITHRDLKPDNLMLDDEGRVKVLDFGLAKLEEGSMAGSGSTEMPTESVTQEGKVLGTVAYMSPEQAEGKSVDARSDVFSLGVVLYEMATGQRPFQGDTSISTITAILRDNPDSVTNLNPRLPRHFGRVIRRCLTKDPDRRYQSALDLRNELEELNREIKSGELDTDTSAAVAALSPPQKSKLVPLLGALVAVLTLVVGYLGFRQVTKETAPAESDTSPTAARAMQIQQLTNTGRSTRAVISPDGKYVMHVDAEAGQQSLWLRQVSTESNVQVAPPAAVTFRSLAFSADGEMLYFVRRDVGSTLSDLYSMPILGGSPIKIMDNVVNFAVSSDGSQIVSQVSDPAKPLEARLVLSDTDGRSQQVLVTKIGPKDLFGPDATWSPDGNTIVYFAGTFTGGFQIWLEAIDLDSGEIRRFAEGTVLLNDMVWLPDGSGILAVGAANLLADDQLWLITYPEGDFQRLTRDLSDYDRVSISADGKSVVAVLSESEAVLWRVDLDEGGTGRQLGNLTGTLNGYNGLVSTAEGQIVFTAGASSGAVYLWKADPDGSELEQLTRGEELSIMPAVCGESLVLTLAPELKSVNLWRMGLDGSGLAKITDGTFDFDPTCTQQGDTLYYTSWEAGTPAIWSGSLEGGATEMVTSSEALGERSPRLSPDGTLLSMEALDPQTNSWKPKIIELATGETVLEIEESDSSDYAWQPDGSALTLVRTTDGVDNVWRYPLAGSEPEQLTFFTDIEEIFTYTWLPDGKTLILSRGAQSSDVVLLTDLRWTTRRP